MSPAHPSQRKLSALGIQAADGRMSFEALPHTAERGECGWSVSWLPDRRDLSQEQAQDAMLIAKLSTGYRVAALARRDWPRIRQLAVGLKVDPREAVNLVRAAEAEAREKAVPTPASQVLHLGVSTATHANAHSRVIYVDVPNPPTVHTPGRVPGQWLMSGEFLDRDREVQR